MKKTDCCPALTSDDNFKGTKNIVTNYNQHEQRETNPPTADYNVSLIICNLLFLSKQTELFSLLLIHS